MRNKQEVDRRVKALSFWQEHGLEATKDAFDVSRPTLFRWKQILKAKQGHLEALDPKSTAPTRRRRRIVPEVVKDTIVRERFFDPRIGKEKLAILLREDKVADLSFSTVGRMLGDLKRQGVLPDPRPLSFNGRTGRHHEIARVYKKKLRGTHHEGSLVKADTVVRFVDGTKRYILTALDVESKFAFAYGFTSHSSKSAAEFINTFKSVAPLQLTHIQTDNGSEFANHFDLALDREGIVHFHTYPRSPKQNAEIERFNRTLSEAFIQYNRSLLAHNLDLFNKKLMDWLLWYNTRRPHWSLGLVSPLRYIVSTLPERESHMLWTSTNPWWAPTSKTREAYYKKFGVELPKMILAGDARNAMGKGKISMKFKDSRVLSTIRIHGTNEERSIGMRVSRGCIRLKNDDIKTLINLIEKSLFPVSVRFTS